MGNTISSLEMHQLWQFHSSSPCIYICIQRTFEEYIDSVGSEPPPCADEMPAAAAALGK